MLSTILLGRAQGDEFARASEHPVQRTVRVHSGTSSVPLAKHPNLLLLMPAYGDPVTIMLAYAELVASNESPCLDESPLLLRLLQPLFPSAVMSPVIAWWGVWAMRQLAAERRCFGSQLRFSVIADTLISLDVTRFDDLWVTKELLSVSLSPGLDMLRNAIQASLQKKNPPPPSTCGVITLAAALSRLIVWSVRQLTSAHAISTDQRAKMGVIGVKGANALLYLLEYISRAPHWQLDRVEHPARLYCDMLCASQNVADILVGIVPSTYACHLLLLIVQVIGKACKLRSRRAQRFHGCQLEQGPATEDITRQAAQHNGVASTPCITAALEDALRSVSRMEDYPNVALDKKEALLKESSILIPSALLGQILLKDETRQENTKATTDTMSTCGASSERAMPKLQFWNPLRLLAVPSKSAMTHRVLIVLIFVVLACGRVVFNAHSRLSERMEFHRTHGILHK